MKFEEIKNKFENDKKINFRLYSLEYMIEYVDNKVQIYISSYKNNRKKFYNSLDELFEEFEVYNINLMNSLNRIQLIDMKEQV